MERKEVGECELGGRHGGYGVGVIVVFVNFCSSFFGGLELGRQGPVVGMDLSRVMQSYLLDSRRVEGRNCWLE